MTAEVARTILGVKAGVSEKDLKQRYRRLLTKYHPDAGGDEVKSHQMAQRIIEAYGVLRDEKPAAAPAHRRGPKKTKRKAGWKAPVNTAAYCPRKVYAFQNMDSRGFTDAETVTGKYYWNPERESFALLAKSVHEACMDILEETEQMFFAESSREFHAEQRELYLIKLFHLLMQEYIHPFYCLHKIGIPVQKEENACTFCFDTSILLWRGFGQKGNSLVGEFVDAFLYEDKLLAFDKSGRLIGRVCFDEDCLYYILLPLFDGPDVKTSVQVKTFQRSEKAFHAGTKLDACVTVTVPPRIPKGRMASHAVQIDMVLRRYRRALQKL